jgi:hypothetical protein
LAKNDIEWFEQMHAINAEAITRSTEDAREEALLTLEGILPPAEYAAVAAAAGQSRDDGGALLKLGNDGSVRVTALARLPGVDYPDQSWRHLTGGPRFDQPRFRAGLLEMAQSAGSPPSAPG